MDTKKAIAEKIAWIEAQLIKPEPTSISDLTHCIRRLLEIVTLLNENQHTEVKEKTKCA